MDNFTAWLEAELETAETYYLLAKKEGNAEPASHWGGYYSAITNALHNLNGMEEN